MSCNESLCWYYHHAVPRTDEHGVYIAGCEWSRFKAPVKDWEATLEVVERGLTWHVVYCPRYRNDMLPEEPAKRIKELAMHNWNKYGIQIFPGTNMFGIGIKTKPGTLTPEERMERRRAASRKWAARNKEYMRNKRKESYHKMHPDAQYRGTPMTEKERKARRNECTKRWLAKNPGYQKRYYEEHKEELNRKHREYTKRRKQQNDALRDQHSDSGLPAD